MENRRPKTNDKTFNRKTYMSNYNNNTNTEDEGDLRKQIKMKKLKQ